MEPWMVREGIHNTGCLAGLGLERWEGALAVNAHILVSNLARGASALEVASSQFNDHGPLRQMGRLSEAQRVLHRCRTVFEQHGALARLGLVFGGLVRLEQDLGHIQQAVDFEKTALHYKYRVGSPENCRISHNPVAALISLQTGSGTAQLDLAALARFMSRFNPALAVPASFDAFCSIVEQVPGVRFRELSDHLPNTYASSGDETLALMAADVGHMMGLVEGTSP